MRKGIGLIGLLLMISALFGCSSSSTNEAAPGDQELTIFAAAQLKDAFTELKEVFEEKEGVEVNISFAGSQVVRTQVEQGAPADVFASANLGHMEALQDKGLVGEDDIFSHNKVTILMPKDNPGGIDKIEDLATKKYRLVIGVETVPVGIYARQFLDNANKVYGDDFKEKVLENVVSLETNTRKVSGKVTLGEADVGIAYITDVIPSIEEKVKTINVPEDLNVKTNNTIAVVNETDTPELAQKWIDFTLSEEGQNILAKHKFTKVK